MTSPEKRRDAPACSEAVSGWRGQAGRAAALAGACTEATRAQIARHRGPSLPISIDMLMAEEVKPSCATGWAAAQEGLPLVYSSAAPEAVRAAQARYGREVVAARIEAFFAETARAMVADGVTRLIVAGGETCDAVLEALAPGALETGPEIAPGVPCLRAGPELVLALKSGDLGGDDFFAAAAARLGRD